MKTHASINRFALKRDKDMSPGARIDWLAAARAFAMLPKKKIRRNTKKKSA